MRVQGPCLILVIILGLWLGFRRYCNNCGCRRFATDSNYLSEGFPELPCARCAGFPCLASATDAPDWCLCKSHKSQSSFGTNFFAVRSHLGGSSRLSFSRKVRSGFCGG